MLNEFDLATVTAWRIALRQASEIKFGINFCVDLHLSS